MLLRIAIGFRGVWAMVGRNEPFGPKIADGIGGRREGMNGDRPNFLVRYRYLLTRGSTVAMGLVLAFGFAAGVVFWGSFNTVLEMTNTEAFCISCHSMKDNVYEEYKTSIHYSTGRACGPPVRTATSHMNGPTRSYARSKPPKTSGERLLAESIHAKSSKPID